MTDITLFNIVKAFEEGKNILDGVTFSVTEGEHIGLLGRNGAGKTTLFKIICGELEEDSGSVSIAPGKKLGLISQIPVYPPEFTTEDVLRSAFDEAKSIADEMRQLEIQMETDDSDETLRRYDHLIQEYARLGGYDADHEVKRVANGLSIPESQLSQRFDTLSGGEKTRANLARLILENTDILLLDEPTNHLDMSAAEWLEDYLTRFKGTAVIISHDRYFLDKVVTRTIEILNGKAEFYSGNYSFYAVEKERRYLEQLKKYEKEQAEIKRLQAAADRLYQWGTQNEDLMHRSQAIEKRIERIRQTGKPQKEIKVNARFGERSFRGDDVLTIKGLSKSFGAKTLFSDVSLNFEPRERIALIGDNGEGKSTLLKLIIGEEKPDRGYIRLGPSVKLAYLPQHVSFPDPYATVLDTVIAECRCTAQTARNRLGSFRFSSDDVFKRVSDLSGGEQSRLRICILMSKDINLLILDEPTNHMDIDSREWIEESVEDYGEALLFVSHDRYFINRFATRIWELDSGTLTDFRGNFEAFRASKNESRSNETKSNIEFQRVKKQKPKRPQSAERTIAKLEREISLCESRKADIEKLKEQYSSDYAKLMELESSEAEIDIELDALYEKWEELIENQ